jgi:hypothetical protein
MSRAFLLCLLAFISLRIPWERYLIKQVVARFPQFMDWLQRQAQCSPYMSVPIILTPQLSNHSFYCTPVATLSL